MPDPTWTPHLVTNEVLADRLGLTVREFQRYYKQGLITVTVESDSVPMTVVCQIGNRFWEAAVADGAIVFEQVRFLRGVRARNNPR